MAPSVQLQSVVVGQCIQYHGIEYRIAPIFSEAVGHNNSCLNEGWCVLRIKPLVLYTLRHNAHPINNTYSGAYSIIANSSK